MKKKINPVSSIINAKFTLPGSKSITNRVMLLSALGKGRVIISGALESEDTIVMREALRAFGVKIKDSGKNIIIDGCGGVFPKKGDIKLNVKNSGTSMRFLAAASALRIGKTTISGVPRMHKRPIDILLKGLQGFGIDVKSKDSTGCPPVVINGNGKIKGGKIKLDGGISSQFFSALLHIASFADNAVEIEITKKLVSKPFLDMTVKILKEFGVKVNMIGDYKKLKIKPQVIKNPKKYQIESDATAASYFWSVAAVTGGTVSVANIPKKSLQGDVEFIQVLKKMGCKINRGISAIKVTGPKNGNLKSLGNIDLSDIPDAAMTAVVLAAVANGKSKITGLSTLRDKETDRISALVTELRKMGSDVKSGADFISVNGKGKNSLHGAEIKTYDDHRMAMCFAVLGSIVSDVVILDPDCVNKTFPDFWEYFAKIQSSKNKIFGDKNLVFTGMRCSGKTAIGKEVAKELGMKFFDCDAELVKVAGKSIPEIVAEHGWDYFRDIEHEICKKAAKLKNTVIATGGGALMFDRNVKLLKKNGLVVFIKVDIDELVRRIKNKEDRPSLTGKHFASEMVDIWNNRKDKYHNVADLICECGSGSVIENAQMVLTKLK